MKIAVCLISGFITFLIGVFFIYFVLSLGLLGATSEKMVNASFILYIVWILISSVMAIIFSFLTAKYLIEKTSLNDFAAILLTIVIFIAVSVISNIIAWILATIVGNLRLD